MMKKLFLVILLFMSNVFCNDHLFSKKCLINNSVKTSLLRDKKQEKNKFSEIMSKPSRDNLWGSVVLTSQCCYQSDSEKEEFDYEEKIIPVSPFCKKSKYEELYYEDPYTGKIISSLSLVLKTKKIKIKKNENIIKN